MKRNDLIHSRLAKIKSRLQEMKFDWAIFAGAAAACYGSNREITDIDVLVRCEDLEKVRAALKDVDTEGFDIGCGADIESSEGVCSFFLDDEMVARMNWKKRARLMVSGEEMGQVLLDTGWKVRQFLDSGGPHYMAIIKKIA